MPEHEPIAADLSIVASVGAPEPTRSEAEEGVGSAKPSDDAKDSQLYEETPVLDVHLPHPTHTWKDFWIHLGTITVGLLIAISLEQSVEALHRAHLRHQLMEDLREECEYNGRVVVPDDFAVADASLKQLLAVQHAIGRIQASGGRLRLPYPQYQAPKDANGVSVSGHVWKTAAWDSAKTSGRIELLPREVSWVYSSIYVKQGDQLNDVQRLRQLADRALGSFERRFADPGNSSGPRLERMDSADLKEYSQRVANLIEAYVIEKQALRLTASSNELVLQGKGSDEIPAAHARWRTVYPDEFDQWEKEIEAGDKVEAGR